MILNMNSLRFIETSVTFHHPREHKIPEDLNLQQHCCEDLKSHCSIEIEVVDMGLVRPPASSTHSCYSARYRRKFFEMSY
jgi:hypothetical protein